MNKRVKQRIGEIFAAIGLAKKEDRDRMTNSDWNRFKASYLEKYGISVDEDLALPEDTGEGTNAAAAEPAALTPELQQQVLAALNEAAAATGTPTTNATDATISGATGTQQPAAAIAAPTTVEGAISAMTAAINTAANGFRRMAKNPEPLKPLESVMATGNAGLTPEKYARFCGHAPHTETHLFGIESDFFRRGSWWNEVCVSGREYKERYNNEDAASFFAAFNKYKNAFADRYDELTKTRQIATLDYSAIIKGESFVDYSRMYTKLGEYIVRRMDAIIAYLRTLEGVGNLFPTVSNVKNKMTAPTAFFEEMSQSYQWGEIFKGAVNFDGEIYHVDDVMFKFAFVDPKELEKMYIAYLDREGSNPMKWTIFEWCFIHFGTILFNEEQKRRVTGVRVPRQGSFPQPANFAADGVLRAIQRTEEELKVLPFKEMKLYDRTTIIDYCEYFWQEVNAILPNMNGLRMYANKKHYYWYLKAYREKYRLDGDFTGTKSILLDLSPENIIWVPNMSMKDYKIWITRPGNVENYEDRPNEMYSFYFEQHIEQLWMFSWWKGGAGVLAPGVQFKTVADLEASGRKMQWIFTNYPVHILDPDATTVDGSLGYEIETAANTAATEITDILNADTDRVYKIICGDMADATEIQKAGNFSKIDSNWKPNAVGDYIKLYAELTETTVTINGKQRKIIEHTGEFLELERKVS